MESSSSSSLCHWDYVNFLILRPILAVLFTISLIYLGWFLAWKLVLVHVPLVQEIFGLRKKPAKPKPPSRRLSRFYDNLNSQTSASDVCFEHGSHNETESSTSQLFVNANWKGARHPSS